MHLSEHSEGLLEVLDAGRGIAGTSALRQWKTAWCSEGSNAEVESDLCSLGSALGVSRFAKVGEGAAHFVRSHGRFDCKLSGTPWKKTGACQVAWEFDNEFCFENVGRNYATFQCQKQR